MHNCDGGMKCELYCNAVIMGALASQSISLTIVYPTVYSRHRSKKTLKLRLTGLCEGEFPAQRASNAANVSVWWRHMSVILKLASPNKYCVLGDLAPLVQLLSDEYHRTHSFSTLVYTMAWYRKERIHFLSQCQTRSIFQNGTVDQNKLFRFQMSKKIHVCLLNDHFMTINGFICACDHVYLFSWRQNKLCLQITVFLSYSSCRERYI